MPTKHLSCLLGLETYQKRKSFCFYSDRGQAAGRPQSSRPSKALIVNWMEGRSRQRAGTGHKPQEAMHEAAKSKVARRPSLRPLEGQRVWTKFRNRHTEDTAPGPQDNRKRKGLGGFRQDSGLFR